MATAAARSTKSDDSIRDDLLSKFESDPKITSSDITVTVKGGVVTLSGFASTYWEKDEAENAAKGASGVRAVANDIKVKLTSLRTDPEIARDAVHALESHVGIPCEKIKTTVQNGWVILEGTVDWPYQKILAEAAVKSLKGVLGITNNIEHRARY
jgi:osmotically-inducible protein OsmY